MRIYIISYYLDFALQQILYGDAIEEVLGELVVFFPHGKSEAGAAALAGLRIRQQAADRGDGCFFQREDFAYSVFGGISCEAVAAFFAADALDELCLYHFPDDNLQVLFGNILPLGDSAQRDVFIAVLACQVQQEPQGISALGGNHVKHPHKIFISIL